MTTVDALVREAARKGGPAVVASTVHLRPATFPGLPVLRAAVFADGAKTWEGGANPGPVVSRVVTNDGEERRVAIVQTVEARAHALSEALREALEASGAGVPVLELYRQVDAQGNGQDLIADSFTAPHRIADAYWREALWPGSGERFFATELGKRLDPAGRVDNVDLLRYYPTCLLFGFDPRAAILSARSGQQARRSRRRGSSSADGEDEESSLTRTRRPYGRLMRSEIAAEIGGFYYRTASLRRPLPAISDVTIYLTPDGDWTLDEQRAARDTAGKPIAYPASRGDAGRPSAIGLDDVTPSVRGVPDIWANTVTLASYVSLAGIRALRFPTLEEDTALLAKELLVAMALAAMLGAERDLHVRSDCDLVLADGPAPITRELLFTDRAGREVVELTYDDAVAALGAAAERAREAGLWSPERIVLVAREELVHLLPPVEEAR